MNVASFQSRIRIVALCVFLFACVLVTKLFFVQIIHQSSYADRADKQYSTPSGDMFNRGTIFMSKKDGSLVAAGTVMTGFKIAIKAKDVTDGEALYTALTPYTKIPHDEFITKVNKKNDPYEEVATHLSKEDADTISALKLSGVSIYKEKWRFYPGGSLSSHTLGFVAYKGNDRVGQYGLEKFYNSILAKGKDEGYVNFFAEVFSNIGKNFSNDREGDIVTTIDPEIEHMLEETLQKTSDMWHADQMGGIIMDPMTGEIYAMAATPSFDLNEFGKVTNTKIYGNPFVENAFEFGSVIKPLVMAGAIDAGVVTPQTTYFDAGKVVVKNRTINNFDLKGRGTATMQTVLDQSLNTGMVFIEQKMGKDSFRSYMKGYGISEKTGVDLPNETSGLTKSLDGNNDVDFANMSFGQGLAITPLQAIRAFASLGNGGNLVTPHFVKQIRYEDGTSKMLDWPVVKNAITKPESSVALTRMLVNVFDKAYGEGKYKFDHYSIATKTGTAQVAREDGKGYYEDRHMHSFFGYFPAYEPKFIVFLFLKNPKEIKYAAQTLILPFVETAKFLINYYNLPPDR